jgi:uncharacterized protein (TIGR02001 family)
MSRVFPKIPLGAILLACAPSYADLNVSANVTLTTDYVSQGISQTQGRPALQGSIDLSGPGGLYAGLWASNVDFKEIPSEDTADRASLEVDVFVGAAGQVGRLGGDIGVAYYAYPGADKDLHYDYWEVAGLLSRELGLLSVSAGLAYSPEYIGRSGKEMYYSLDLALTGPEEVRFGLHMGRENIEDNIAYGVHDYTDWKVSAFKDFDGFGIELGYTDTDLSDAECFDGSNLCGPRVALTVSRTL